MTDRDALATLHEIKALVVAIAERVGVTLPSSSPEPDTPADDGVEGLRQWCREHGHAILPNDEVKTATAAALLGVQPQTLRQDRSVFGRIPFRRLGGRARYRLIDLAEYLKR
jgi:hypothetical protein